MWELRVNYKMKEYLKKLKLVDQLTTEIEIERNQFVGRFKEHVDQGDTSIFSDIFDVFSSSKNEYKGNVNHAGFKIKRRRRFFDMNMGLAIATGKFHEKENTLVISTEINSFHGIMIPFYIFIAIFYLIFIFGFSFVAFTGESNGEVAFAIPFLLFHAAFMFGIPYFMMRRSTSRMKRELEREFFYMTKGKGSA